MRAKNKKNQPKEQQALQTKNNEQTTKSLGKQAPGVIWGAFVVILRIISQIITAAIPLLVVLLVSILVIAGLLVLILILVIFLPIV